MSTKRERRAEKNNIIKNEITDTLAAIFAFVLLSAGFYAFVDTTFGKIVYITVDIILFYFIIIWPYTNGRSE
jgi:uncharacterized membrane protein